MPDIPARLHIILARDADSAVIIRRGPAKRVCVLEWNCRKDTFKLGQWFKGRIYERRCDLSPDGKYLIYFAMNGRPQSAGGSWTAISRVPYLKAIGFWPHGGSTWNGGGLFTSNFSYWLNSPPFGDAAEPREPKKFRKDPVAPFQENFGGECPGVYYPRLQRDGWEMINDVHPANGYTLFQKPLTKGWLLKKKANEGMGTKPGQACYHDTHSLIHPKKGLKIPCPDWEWADLDRHRLVFVKGGILYATTMEDEGLGPIKELHDFIPMSFEALEAPY